jgi:hypothetical protein
MPLPPDSGELPRAPVSSSAKPVQPHALPEEAPLTSSQASPILPQRPRLPAGPLVRLPGPDITKPVPLPILATGVTDRAPLTDPSGDASLAAALARPIPIRTTPAPFVPLNVPDPFENRRVAQLSPPPEDPHPPISVVRTPVK